jgi:hypothetical protein
MNRAVWAWEPDVAILRKCVRCSQWITIDNFQGTGHMCRPCLLGRVYIGNAGSISRTIVMTDKGRAKVAELLSEQ